jgi:hypothetical protein
LEALPWEAKALDGLELPTTSFVMMLGSEKGQGVEIKKGWVVSVK